MNDMYNFIVDGLIQLQDKFIYELYGWPLINSTDIIKLLLQKKLILTVKIEQYERKGMALLESERESVVWLQQCFLSKWISFPLQR